MEKIDWLGPFFDRHSRCACSHSSDLAGRARARRTSQTGSVPSAMKWPHHGDKLNADRRHRSESSSFGPVGWSRYQTGSSSVDHRLCVGDHQVEDKEVILSKLIFGCALSCWVCRGASSEAHSLVCVELEVSVTGSLVMTTASA